MTMTSLVSEVERISTGRSIIQEKNNIISTEQMYSYQFLCSTHCILFFGSDRTLHHLHQKSMTVYTNKDRRPCISIRKV
jgi:hypothetical protein